MRTASTGRFSQHGRAMALAAVGALVLAASAQADPYAPPLDQHRPVLRYDSHERYFAQRVPLPPGEARVIEDDRVYGHIAEQDGRTWLQYWMYYADNPQDRGIVKTGRHEGDWEMIQVGLDAGGDPELVTFAQHTWAEACSWDQVEHRGGGPVAYIANASHPAYSEPGLHDRPWPDPNDEADGDGPELRPPVTVIDDGHPAWVEYDGPWGDTEDSWIPAEAPSPPGPKFQETNAWTEPTSFHESAIPCGADPPRRGWQTALEIGAVAVILLLLVRAYRRRRT